MLSDDTRPAHDAGQSSGGLLWPALLVCGAWACVAALIIPLLRAPVGETFAALPASALARAVGLALALMLCAAAAGLSRSASLRPVALIALPTGLLICLATLGTDAPVVLDALVAGAALAGAAGLLRRLPTGIGPRLVVSLGVCGVVLALGHAAMIQNKGYAHPLIHELAVLGAQHPDTLLHAAIAGFLTENGVASAGLDGLKPIAYHVASHRLVGGFAAWAGVDAPLAYALFLPVVGAPVTLLWFVAAASAVRGAAVGEALTPAGQAGAAVSLIALAAFAAQAGGGSLWYSESYQISLWAMFAAVAAKASARPGAGPLADAALVALLAAMTALAALAKISTGAVLACGLAAWLSWPAPPTARRLIAAALVFAPFPAVLLSGGMLEQSGGDSIFGLFHLFHAYPAFAMAHVVLAAVILVASLRIRPQAPEARAALFGLTIMSLAGLVSASILKMPAGNALYFAGPGLWAALCLAGALTPPAAVARAARAPLAATAAPVLIVAALFIGDDDLRKGPRRYVAALDRIEAAGGPAGLAALPAAMVVRRIEQDPEIDGVSVAPDVPGFWGQGPRCWAASLVVPALTARPMLQGLHAVGSDCVLTPWYGWADYDRAASAARAIDDPSLCEAAALRGMRVILRAEGRGLRVIDCDA